MQEPSPPPAPPAQYASTGLLMRLLLRRVFRTGLCRLPGLPDLCTGGRSGKPRPSSGSGRALQRIREKTGSQMGEDRSVRNSQVSAGYRVGICLPQPNQTKSKEKKDKRGKVEGAFFLHRIVGFVSTSTCCCTPGSVLELKLRCHLVQSHIS